MRWVAVGLLLAVVSAGAQSVALPIVEGKRALAAKQFVAAKRIFAEYLRAHPGDVQGELGVADAELGLHQYEAAELLYRRVVAVEPLLWAAHKNLVIVEAALGRWEEFDRERELLRAARERGAAGISAKDSDVIEVLNVRGERWIVRDYFEPLGRARARYNFERFSPDGRVLAYVSLESANALRDALTGGAVVVGVAPRGGDGDGFALDFYDGKSHGTIARYAVEPSYERVRANFLKWVRGRKV
jgi:hypothetical protein